jgi:hypothetical protein
MSLDITLIQSRRISYDEGVTWIEDSVSVYECNITHNLSRMAFASGIQDALWSPEDLNITKAGEIIDILENGLNDLKARPEHFKKFNASNGWGLYEHFVPFVEEYLNACKEYPNSIINTSR